MLKISQKQFILPLKEKIRIQGLRVVTNNNPQLIIDGHILYLSDNWNLQLAYSTYDKNSSQAAPSLMEFPVIWNDQFEFPDELPDQIIINYKKKPFCVASHIIETKGKPPLLQLTMETLIEISLEEKTSDNTPPTLVINDNPTPPLPEKHLPDIPLEKKAIPKNTQYEQAVNTLEEKYTELLNQVNFLKNKIKEIEQSLANPCPAFSRLAGSVMDAFRLIPVGKAVIELYLNNKEEPFMKTATDMRGVYVFTRLLPGIYDVKIKHPRYQTLEVKDYVVQELEDKGQDFLLRR